MRQRYRIYVCPEPQCAAVGKSASSICPTHEEPMKAVIVRVEDGQDKAIRMKDTADRLAQAGTKVGEAACKPGDVFGIGAMFQGIADEWSGKKARPPREPDIDNEDDEDEEDEL